MHSHRLATSVSLLWAWFIWTSYNAGLSSEFTVPIKKLPFNDMESLSKTNYRYEKSCYVGQNLCLEYRKSLIRSRPLIQVYSIRGPIL